MKKRFLGIGSLALLQIAIVANLQPLAANATYGFTLPFIYLCAVIGFFLPCLLMVAELATAHPQTGGSYIWAEKAFGKKFGFITVVLLWVSNLLWYPSIFSLIATNAAYVFVPDLAMNKTFIISLGLMMFWTITGLNCIGVKLSSRLSIVFAVVGIIMPIIVIIIGGLVWWLGDHPIALTLKDTPLVPDLKSFNHLGLIIAVATSLFGIEVPAVHSGDVANPKRDFPLSLLISGTVIIALLLSVELSLAIIVPPDKLSLLTGILDAIKTFLSGINLNYLIAPILFLVLIGNIGSITAWMLGSTRGMFVACKSNNIMPLLQKTNRAESPVGVLLIEAVIFTLVSGIFLILPQIVDSFWLLLDVASQISIIYYIILFATTLRLRNITPLNKNNFIIPGGKGVLWIVMGLGIITAALALLSGFIAPPDLSSNDAITFHIIMFAGLFFAAALPLILIYTRKFNEEQQ
jgi:glutamate:GABA antiporter